MHNMSEKFSKCGVGGITASQPKHLRRRAESFDHFREVLVFRHDNGMGHFRGGEYRWVLCLAQTQIANSEDSHFERSCQPNCYRRG